MKQDTRAGLRSVFEESGLRPVWVLLSHLVRPAANRSSWIYLSPCERDFLRQTPYDEIGVENHLLADDFGSSLHYLDVEQSRLITFRSLERVHAPNVFAGRREECPLDQVRGDFAGEFVHPDEERDLSASRTVRVHQTERVKRWLEPPRVQQPALFQQPIMPMRIMGAAAVSAQVTCIYCGESTDDWWAAWSENEVRLGKCRVCLDKGYG